MWWELVMVILEKVPTSHHGKLIVKLNSPNGLTTSIANEILTLQGSSLNINHLSSMSLNAER
jgi:hypothetical protein